MDIMAKIYWTFKLLNKGDYNEEEGIEKVRNVVLSSIGSERVDCVYYKVGDLGLESGSIDDHIYSKEIYKDSYYQYILCNDRINKKIDLFVYSKDTNLENIKDDFLDYAIDYYAVTEE